MVVGIVLVLVVVVQCWWVSGSGSGGVDGGGGESCGVGGDCVGDGVFPRRYVLTQGRGH